MTKYLKQEFENAVLEEGIFTENEVHLIHKIIEKLIEDIESNSLNNKYPQYKEKLKEYLKKLNESHNINKWSIKEAVDYLAMNNKKYQYTHISGELVKEAFLDKMYTEYGLEQDDEIFLSREVENNYLNFLYGNIRKVLVSNKVSTDQENLFLKIISILPVQEDNKDDLYKISMKNFEQNKNTLNDFQYMLYIMNFSRLIIKYNTLTTFSITKNGEELMKTLEGFVKKKQNAQWINNFSILKNNIYRKTWYDNDDCENEDVLNECLNPNNAINSIGIIKNGIILPKLEIYQLNLWDMKVEDIFEKISLVDFEDDGINYILKMKTDSIISIEDSKDIFIKLINDLSRLPKKPISEYQIEMNSFIREKELKKKIISTSIASKNKKKI